MYIVHHLFFSLVFHSSHHHDLPISKFGDKIVDENDTKDLISLVQAYLSVTIKNFNYSVF